MSGPAYVPMHEFEPSGEFQGVLDSLRARFFDAVFMQRGNPHYQHYIIEENPFLDSEDVGTFSLTEDPDFMGEGSETFEVSVAVGGRLGEIPFPTTEPEDAYFILTHGARTDLRVTYVNEDVFNVWLGEPDNAPIRDFARKVDDYHISPFGVIPE